MAAPVDPQPSGVQDDRDAEERWSKDDAQNTWKLHWDTLCAYKTFKVVRIKDRKLGILYWGIVTMVIVYIIIFALCVEGKHQYQEPGIGTVITKFKGKAFFDGKVYDEADLRFPEVEPFGAFIMTKSITMKGQMLGNCIDYDNPCPCRVEAECVDGQYCKDAAWCPSLGEGNALDPPKESVVETMQGLQHTVLQIMTGIAFPGIGNYFFVTGKSPGANNPYKNITLKELLSHAQPTPVKLEDVLETGALISVSFFWNCDVDVDCEPAVIVKRQDSGKGFVQKRVRHRTIGGQRTRDAIYMYGLRILVESSGIGRRVSVVLIVIQVGSGLALLRTASMAADFLMLSGIQNKVRRDAYYKCKVEETQDYSDLQDRINLVNEQLKEREREKKTAAPGESTKSKKVSLGLGPGRKGGLGSHILQGRK